LFIDIFLQKEAIKMKSKKLSVKDLKTIGIFTIVYFVVIFGVE